MSIKTERVFRVSSIDVAARWRRSENDVSHYLPYLKKARCCKTLSTSNWNTRKIEICFITPTRRQALTSLWAHKRIYTFFILFNRYKQALILLTCFTGIITLMMHFGEAPCYWYPYNLVTFVIAATTRPQFLSFSISQKKCFFLDHNIFLNSSRSW